MCTSSERSSRIARLPAPLRPLATLVRDAVRPPPSFQYPWEADGMATWHYSPFLDDPDFSKLYEEMISEWYVTKQFDVRWRMWLLTRFALQARDLPGAFCEFGSYRAGCAFMILGVAVPDRLYLFDTFRGISPRGLNQVELPALTGEYADTSPEYVASRLAKWSEHVEIVAGDVFDTVPHPTGPLAFVHMDLNAAEATRHCLIFAYDQLVPGGIMVFDDYGCDTYAEQRRVIEDELGTLGSNIIAFPTAQAVVIKKG